MRKTFAPITGARVTLKTVPDAFHAVECNGEDPCASCERRLVRCRFNDNDQKILVSETYAKCYLSQKACP
ncbi:C6 transcription factor [Colletotrichum asianum]